MENNKLQLYPMPYKGVACHTFNCRTMGSWFIGRPDGPNNLNLVICEQCKNDLAQSMKESEPNAPSENQQPKSTKNAKGPAK